MTEQNVHRILDQAFAGVELTPEVQDLKEEIRANLVARVAELEAVGRSAHDAVRTAVEEVGDLRAAVAEVAAASGASAWAAHERLVALHRVRPRPVVVVGLVVLSAALTTALVLIVLGATGLVAMSPASAALKGVAGALLAGGIVVVALRQETTVHYPMPLGRAAGWGAATAAGVLAVALGTTFVGDTSRLALLEAAIGLAVAATAGLVTLGATQTNRTKGWVRDAADQSQDRFSQDPAAAARFGIYSGALWFAALSTVVVVGLTAGWLWSWTPLVAALLVEMVLLARMQFPTDHRGE
jgi:hypothetical protein